MTTKNGAKNDFKAKKDAAGDTTKQDDAKSAENGVKKGGAEQPGAGAAPLFRPLGQYIKDLSFECPKAPIFTPEGQRDMDMNVGVSAAQLNAEQGLYEVSLAIRARAADSADVTVFVAELAYCGVFEVRNLPAEQLDMVLHVEGASLLFPFARQIMMATLTNSGFKAPLLEPINFGALYLQGKNTD